MVFMPSSTADGKPSLCVVRLAWTSAPYLVMEIESGRHGEGGGLAMAGQAMFICDALWGGGGHVCKIARKLKEPAQYVSQEIDSSVGLLVDSGDTDANCNMTPFNWREEEGANSIYKETLYKCLQNDQRTRRIVIGYIPRPYISSSSTNSAFPFWTETRRGLKKSRLGSAPASRRAVAASRLLS